MKLEVLQRQQWIGIRGTYNVCTRNGNFLGYLDIVVVLPSSFPPINVIHFFSALFEEVGIRRGGSVVVL